MSAFSRRSFIRTLSLTAAAAAPGLGIQEATAQSGDISIPDAFATRHEPKPLAFQADQLEGLSENLINSHWENNYIGSVNALNTIKGRLNRVLDEEDDVPAFVYNDLKREHLMRTGSVILHEFYFDNMAPPGERDGELDRHLRQAFGSPERWEKEFRLIASGLGGGSGWTMLAWNTYTETLENYWMGDHMHYPATAKPILVMDMYEHSYHMDYGAAAGAYIDAFMRNINWQVVADRLGTAVEGRG